MNKSTNAVFRFKDNVVEELIKDPKKCVESIKKMLILTSEKTKIDERVDKFFNKLRKLTKEPYTGKELDRPNTTTGRFKTPGEVFVQNSIKENPLLNKVVDNFWMK